MSTPSLARQLTAEALGTALLLATVIGSGVMGDTLAAGNTAVALLGNTIATGAILFVLITVSAMILIHVIVNCIRRRVSKKVTIIL